MTWQTLGGHVDPRAWAKALREREQAGDHLTIFQRQAWREALKETAREIADRPS